jgi:hypothetical protein
MSHQERTTGLFPAPDESNPADFLKNILYAIIYRVNRQNGEECTWDARGSEKKVIIHTELHKVT